MDDLEQTDVEERLPHDSREHTTTPDVLRPPRGPCGTVLAHRATGRPRVTCSDRCKRRRDGARRAIARRQQWIATWREQGLFGDVPVVEAEGNVQLLEADIDDLLERVEAPASSLLLAR